MTVIAASMLVFWNESTAWWHLWFDIVPQGLGMASVITTTLIVSVRTCRAGPRSSLVGIISGNDSKRCKGRSSRRDRKYVRVRGLREVCTDSARSAVTYLFRTTGQVLGVSLSGALLQAVLTRKLRERITGPGAIEVSCVTYPYDSLLRAPRHRLLSKYGPFT